MPSYSVWPKTVYSNFTALIQYSFYLFQPWTCICIKIDNYMGMFVCAWHCMCAWEISSHIASQEYWKCFLVPDKTWYPYVCGVWIHNLEWSSVTYHMYFLNSECCSTYRIYLKWVAQMDRESRKPLNNNFNVPETLKKCLIYYNSGSPTSSSLLLVEVLGNTFT